MRHEIRADEVVSQTVTRDDRPDLHPEPVAQNQVGARQRLPVRGPIPSEVEGLRVGEDDAMGASDAQHAPDDRHGLLAEEIGEWHPQDPHDRPGSKRCFGRDRSRELRHRAGRPAHAASRSASTSRYVTTRRLAAMLATASRRTRRFSARPNPMPGWRAIRASTPSPVRSNRSAAWNSYEKGAEDRSTRRRDQRINAE